MSRNAKMSRSNPTLGILLMLCFCIIAPMMDAAAKLASAHVPTGQIATIRFALQCCLLLPFVFLTGRFYIPDSKETLLHFFRALMILGATSAFFSAIKYLPLADAMAIFFVEPFLLTLLSAIVLKESIGWRRITACAVGFSGALLVIQPSFEAVGWVATYPLITALLFSIYMLLTRSMALTQDPITMQSYTGLAAVIIGVPILWLADGSGSAFLDPVWPPRETLMLFAFIGVTATVSHLCLSFALAYAPASLIAPLQYFEIVTAATLGYFLFSDVTGSMGMLGIVIIIASGLFVFSREQQLQSTPQAPTATPPAAPSVPSPNLPPKS